MTDVRLTATNPEDSSVVPVACNSKGELLVTEPVIESIPNDVTISGRLTLDLPGDTEDLAATWDTNKNGSLFFQRDADDKVAHRFDPTGQTTHRHMGASQKGTVGLATSDYGASIYDSAGALKWSIGWNGTATASNLLLRIEANNPSKWSSADSSSSSNSPGVYIGSVLDVTEELLFLRDQVRALMEKLKMTPEGGWPVWDGSSETTES